jgi:hypothetical protein
LKEKDGDKGGVIPMNKWIRGTNAAVLSIAVIGIFIVLTIFLNSIKGLQVDLTLNKKFTLSEQTINVLKSIDKDVHIMSFSSDGTDPFIKRQVLDLVEEYKKRNGKITFDEYDIATQPSLAKQYDVDPEGMLVVESGTQKKNVPFYNMFIPGQQQGEYRFSGEEKLTQALAGLSVKDKRKVYFLSGHQEIPLNQMNTWRSGLEGDNYEVKELNLLRDGTIPADAETIFIIGATNDLSDKEAELIQNFVKGNGKLYIALGFNKDMATGWKNIQALLGTFGIQSQNAVAIEPKQSVMYDPLTIIPEYGFHDITEKLQQYSLLTMISNAITLTSTENPNYPASMIMRTTSNAYGETNLELLLRQQSKQEDDDIKAPLNLAYAIQTSDKKPKAIILGGGTFLLDNRISLQGNRDFALNSVAWLSEQKDSVTIRPREGDAIQQAMIMPSQANTIFFGTVLLFPLLFLIIGGWIWWRRRQG